MERDIDHFDAEELGNGKVSVIAGNRAEEFHLVQLAPGRISHYAVGIGCLLYTSVTDTRANTHHLVTEYGMVNLKGLSTWQRAEAIISIAHPQFRDELIAEAEKMHIWRRSNKR